MKIYYVYIMTNNSRTLYTGITNDLPRRVEEHRQGVGGAFTARYKINQLVYHEEHRQAIDAIAREKEIKGWRREKKIALIESLNPHWEDLSVGW
ncbi:MAG: GIY-YIG nuclease family protein [Planctomycetes bacterium]|nr:GIY-YIG nuclease family protein [Planctomycetota bacterium]